ncbi:MAG: hypothetical protein IJR61_06175 [Clostridia bacterium]|nr:hypothetical protein [Clostridia bacterium]
MAKIKKFSEAAWALGMIILTLAVCLMAKAGFGVSMVVSPAYVIHLALVKKWTWFTFGTSEYILQGIFLAIMCVIVRRFKWQYLLSFAAAVIYGLLLDGWFLLLGGQGFENIYARIAAFAAGIILTGISVALFFRTYLPIEVYDLFITEVSERYGFRTGVVKWVYDLSMLALAVVLTLIFNGGLAGIGVGTAICAVVNAPIITLFGKLFDKFINFDPLFPAAERVLNVKGEGRV